MIDTTIRLLAVLTLLSNIFLLLAILLYLGGRVDKRISEYWKKLVKIINQKEINYAFVVSLTATLGSLFLSEVAHFEPCKLCWFQRIFMYPTSIILGTALLNKYKDVFRYILPLSLIGLAIALYHYYFQVTGSALIPCSTVGFSVSCSQRFFTYYGYITIPWMSFSAFSLLTFFLLLSKSHTPKD